MKFVINPRLLRLMEIALQFEGVTEEGKDNYGEQVEKFQKAVDGKAQGEPWCLAFLQYCIKQVEKEIGYKSAIYKTESVLEMWNKTPRLCRLSGPVEGSIMVWQYYTKDGHPTNSGHAELVVEIISEQAVKTIGGNTSKHTNIVDKNGDGVYVKTRSTKGSSQMKVVGWLMPWV